MRTLKNFLAIITLLLIMTSCYGQRGGAIEFDKKKIGGLYETNANGKVHRFYTGSEALTLDTVTFISFSDFERIAREESEREGDYSLVFRLNDAGTLKFKEMTARNVGKPICFVIGNKILSAPTVLITIPNGQGIVTVADQKTLDEMIEALKN